MCSCMRIRFSFDKLHKFCLNAVFSASFTTSSQDDNRNNDDVPNFNVNYGDDDDVHDDDDNIESVHLPCRCLARMVMVIMKSVSGQMSMSISQNMSDQQSYKNGTNSLRFVS